MVGEHLDRLLEVLDGGGALRLLGSQLLQLLLFGLESRLGLALGLIFGFGFGFGFGLR